MIVFSCSSAVKTSGLSEGPLGFKEEISHGGIQWQHGIEIDATTISGSNGSSRRSSGVGGVCWDTWGSGESDVRRAGTAGLRWSKAGIAYDLVARYSGIR